MVPKVSIEPTRARVTPLPKDQWPIWASAVAKFRHAEDVGLGDTVVHLIGDERSEWFKTWFHQKFGKTCGCSNRQAWLNRRFPYG